MSEVGKVATPALENGAHLHVISRLAPNTENGKVIPPRRQPNRDRRTREHLTPNEVEALMAAASDLGRHGHRDATLILVAYRHGLRVSDPSDLLTVAQAAKRTPLSEPSLRARIDRGEIKCVRIGGHIFLEEKELQEKFGSKFKPTE